MALNLPGAAVRALTEDELKEAKDVLVARAASASRAAPAKMSAQIAMASGEWIPAFQVTLQSFLEMRTPKLEPVTRPFKEGMVLPEVPAPVKEPFDVWSFPVEPRKDASVQRMVAPIASTLEKKDCTVCLGKGAAPCKACFSKGVVNCDACMGAGSQPCAICKGLSKISCPDCEGTGRIKSGGMTNKMLGPCGSCGGAGKFNCNHCSGGKVDCATCSNAGKKPCPACAGKGRMECASCGGSAKVVVGTGFGVEFRPQQATISGLASPAPQGVLDMALGQKSAPSSAEFASEADFRAAVAGDGIPAQLRTAIEQATARLKPTGSTVRLGSTKLSVSQGGVWRVTGAFSGHDFAYWIHPQSKSVVAEKDPLKDVSQKSVETAQAALKQGDWETALDAARETLSLDPHHAEAKGLFAEWRGKLVRESLVVGLAGGAVGAAVSAAAIYAADKGLHRLVPAVVSAVMSLAAGSAGAFILLPVTRRLFPAKKRLMTAGGASLGAMILFFFVTRVVLGWNPVKSADQKALDGEMKEKFNDGVSAVYREEELKSLQDLYDKYKNSQADLSPINTQLQAQLALQAEHEALTKEFAQKLDEALNSNGFLSDKRAKIVELKDYYSLRNVDVTPAEKALQQIDEQMKQTALPSRTRSSGGHISITPLHPASARASAPVRRGTAPAKKAAPAAKGVSAKAKAAPAKPRKKKSIKPNQEVDPNAKKKGTFSERNATVD